MSTKKGYIPNPDILTLNKVNESKNATSKASMKRFNEDRFSNENNSSNIDDSISSAQNSSKVNLNNEKISLINNFKDRNNNINKSKSIESEHMENKKSSKAIIELKKMDSKSSKGKEESRINTKTFQEDDDDEDENYGQKIHHNIRKLIKKEKIVSIYKS